MLKKSLNPTIVRLFVAVAVLATLTFGVHTASAQSLNPTEVTYDENDDAEVGTYRASDPQGRTITWSVGGTDADDFEIDEDTGVLTFKSPPNFEMSTASGTANEYVVEVQALGSTLATVTVTVKDLDEDGTIELSTLQPEEGVSLMGEGLADEDDGDDVSQGLSYQWAASSNGTTGWAEIEDATDIAYTPVAGDVGKYLRLTATYGDTDLEDDEDTSKTAPVVSANQVQEHITTNTVPVFPDQDPGADVDTAQTRELPEDAAAGDPVGDPVVATDDRGELTYTLAGTGFTIDRATGQIEVGSATIDFETSGSNQFTVTVTATDGSGAATNPTATVTINVTDVNEKPTVTGPATALINEDAEILTVGSTFDAIDLDQVDSANETTTWSVSGDDASLFEIDPATGQISFKSQPDFEAHATINDTGDGLEAMLKVKAMATDSRGLSGESAEMVVTITNMQEPGEVTLSTQQPQAGISLTASLTDPDGGPVANNVQGELEPTWQWARSTVADDQSCADATNWGEINEDAEEASYTPVSTDVDQCLRAVATYDDGLTTGENATGVSANPVLEARAANKAPEFKVTDEDGNTETIMSDEREVDENSPAGTPVGAAVTATDADDGDNPTHSLGGADAASFDIEPGSGQIRVSDAADLDFETKATYRVIVTATDGNRASTSIPVTISLEGKNEAPEVSGPSEVEDYAENGEGDVGAYTATDQDRNVDHDQDDETPLLAMDTVTWSLGGVDEGDFDIDDNGVLSFKNPPDYDDPADADMDNEYKVMVVATDSAGNEGMQSVTVTVTDLDEPGTVTLTAEQPGVGVQVTASVMDEDEADSMAGATWQWSSSGTAGGGFDDIDGADGASYTPVADDAGNYLRATVTYGTEDNPRSEHGTSANPVKAYDNVNAAPVFPDQDPDTDLSQTAQEREVPENSAAGTPVGDPVMATDSNDIDVLTYTLADTTADSGDSDSFGIDQATGQISVSGSLDHETKGTYEVTVTATDGSGASASAEVTITVTDLNEAPDVTAPATPDTEVDEDDTATELEIGTYEATDEDGDTISWDVEGPDAAAFEISDVGLLSLKSAPDYEAKGSAAGDNNYKVTVVASDPDGLRDTESVTVMIVNVNEPGTITLSTLQPQVGVPLTATLTDPDGIVGDVTWNWAGGADESGTAAINAYTPVAADSGTLSVTATYRDGQLAADDTTTQRTANADTANPVIARQATNAAPEFPDQDGETEGDQSDEATREVIENAAEDADVGLPVTAGDDDTHHAATLTYSLNGPDADSFKINRATGQIQVSAAAMLDYESDKKTYMVTVTATDGSGASDSIDVTITVTDFEEPPMLADTTDPEFASATTTRSVAENTAAGEDIGDPVEATDLDGDTLTYTLGGDDAASFDIDAATGQLMTKAELDFETAESHTVTVTASDGTEDGTDATITVTVMVTDENDAPEFASATATRSVAENTAAGENIGAPVAATDDDGDTLTYTLGGDDAASFDIATSTGQLMTKAELDFETDDSYTVTVTVTASDDTEDATITVTVMVTDVNEAPEFALATTTRSVAENTAAGENIGEPLAATDVDAGATLTYSLGGDDAASFDIATSTGQLMTKAELDFEAEDSYSVTVTASDDAEEAAIMVTIMVTDENDAPEFASATTTRSVAENTAAGMDIGEPVEATDDDGDTLTYTLGGDDAASFDIATSTGQLMTKAALDFEAKDSYSVTVTASDGTEEGTVTVTVLVTDENEAPEFASATTTRSVAENTAAGMDIGEPVEATDVDAGATLTYTLGGDDADSFDIATSTGQLMTKAELDFETKDSYTVTVTASDGTEEAAIMVTITVTDENDAPEFASATTTRSVAENTAAGMDIGEPVEATDVDAGATLTYTLGGDDADSFDIATSTGQLLTKADLDFETADSHTVTVTASDGTEEAAIMVTIMVTDVDEEPGLMTRYDADDTGDIDKDEAIAAINDYLFGEGDAAITKADAIAVINLYLFGSS